MIDWPSEIKKFALKLANDFIIIYTILKALKVELYIYDVNMQLH